MPRRARYPGATTAPRIASTMKTARQNVVNVSICTNPLNAVPAVVTSGPLTNAMTRPATTKSDSQPRSARRGRAVSMRRTSTATAVTTTSGMTATTSFILLIPAPVAAFGHDGSRAPCGSAGRSPSSPDHRWSSDRHRSARREREDALDRRLDDRDERLREHAHDDGEDEERGGAGDLERREVRQQAIRLADRAEHDALEHPEQVDRSEDDTGRGERAPEEPTRPGRRVEAERAEQHEELSDEAGESGEPERRQHEHAEERRVQRPAVRQAAEVRDEAAVRLLVLDPDEEEEGTGDDAVVQHLQGGPDRPLQVQHEDAERDEAHVRDRRVRDELLQILLDRGHDGPVHDRDDGQEDERGDPELGAVREERQAEADEAVAAGLQQDAREDDRAGRRRLDVGIRQPGVERDHRHLDREGEREREEGPHLELEREGAASLDEDGQRERAVAGFAAREIHRDDADEHEQRSREREDDELQRRVDAALAAPDADDQVHRHEHQLEEHVEEEEVEREEHADHADLEQEESGHELRHALLDRPAARIDDRDEGEERRHDHEQHGDPIHAELVADAEAREPGRRLRELEARLPDLEAREHDERDCELDRGREDRDLLRRARVPPEHDERDEPEQRDDDEQREDVVEAHRRMNPSA